MAGFAARAVAPLARSAVRARTHVVRRAGDNYLAPGESLPFNSGKNHKAFIASALVLYLGTGWCIPFVAARISIHNKNLQDNAMWC